MQQSRPDIVEADSSLYLIALHRFEIHQKAPIWTGQDILQDRTARYPLSPAGILA